MAKPRAKNSGGSNILYQPRPNAKNFQYYEGPMGGDVHMTIKTPMQKPWSEGGPKSKSPKHSVKYQ